MMSQTTATFLAEHDLSSYTAAFDEHGWDSLPALQDISDDDLKQLVTDVAMKSGHAARLRTALGKAPAAAATAPAENGPAVSAVLAAPAAAGQSDPWVHHLSRPVPKPLRFRSSCTTS